MKQEQDAQVNPIPILKDFLPYVVTPVSAIYREAITSHQWSQYYKQEQEAPAECRKCKYNGRKQRKEEKEDLRKMQKMKQALNL